jgi:hypothetical protein
VERQKNIRRNNDQLELNRQEKRPSKRICLL